MITSLLIYKTASLLVGLVFAYMGYRLFMAGVWGEAGDLDAQFGKNKLLLKKAAPGTFFVLFGAIVIALTIWKGFTVNTFEQKDHSSVQNETEQNKVDLPKQLPF